MLKGNSGAELVDTVTKFHHEAAIEGYFCQHLGDGVCPTVYNISQGFSSMEKLEEIQPYEGILLAVENILDSYVWSRPTQNYDVSGQMNYIEFLASMRIKIPDWAIPKEFCLIHGDPTVSNVMMRREDKRLILIDPRAPNGHIPSWKAVDMGKILQSYWGWEHVAYGTPYIEYDAPVFCSDPDLMRQANFWCFYHVARIEQLEISRGLNRPNILAWCDSVMEKVA